MVNKFLDVFKLTISLAGLISTFYAVIELTYFLSVPRTVKLSAKDPWLESSWALLVDMCLLTLFIIQHSTMASESFKHFLYSYKIRETQRSLYVISTAAFIWILIKYWQVAPILALWQLDFSYKPALWLYIGIHFMAWIIIYVANICTDVTELLGIKQVYYSLVNLPDPNRRKSYQLRKLTTHMRHPSFLGFLLIFWFFPVMTLDRLLLAAILTSYMYIAWNTDGEDYEYQKSMYQRKYHELQRLNSLN
ncbi:nurim homolog [Cylas formicarius]|uniref:nurim homolog n=1 Tax=Cylas formicarius TaxID=197179 RepID=UPI0029584DFD|nr:nurim homolog [Cylas formicarius]